MINEDSSNKKNNPNNTNTSTMKIKQEFELIKKYLNFQPERLKQLNDISKNLNNIVNNFIEFTKIYSNQIESLAMKITPNYSIEGQFMQAIQTVLLFYSDGFNKLISKLKMNINLKKLEDSFNILEQFNLQKKLYIEKIKNVDSSHKSFKKEINLYQEYLVNKEFKEHKKKGEIVNTDDAIIEVNEIIKKKSIDNKSDDINNNNDEDLALDEEDPFEVKLSEIDNKSELVQTNKTYIKNINESNDILNKIRKFLKIEKSNILKSVFNLCHHFLEGLQITAENMKQNFVTQTEVINNLLNKVTQEETDNTCLSDGTIKLKFLEIYNNNILSKIDLYNNIYKIENNNTKKNRKNSEQSIKKSVKKLNSKDRLSINTNDINPKLNTSDRKTINLSHKQININYLNRASFNPNQMMEVLDEEKEEKFEEMVKKLNRDEIINIFEQIKDTNIILNESDIKLIEYEKNYKKIKAILVILFIHPEQFKEDDKKTLIENFEKDEKYILYLIKVLNDHRSKGNFYISELTLKYFGEIFKYLNNIILSTNNIQLFKYILILSMTYFYFSEKENKKTYLFTFIKDCPNYSNKKFWEDYLKEMIKHDIKDIDFDKINLETMTKDEKEKISNSFFSNFLTVSKTMTDFNLDNKFIKEFIENNKDKYFLSQEQINNIFMLLEVNMKEVEANNIKEIKNDNDENNKKDNENKTNIIENKIENVNENKKIEIKEVDNNQESLQNDKNENNIQNNADNEVINEEKNPEIKQSNKIEKIENKDKIIINNELNENEKIIKNEAYNEDKEKNKDLKEQIIEEENKINKEEDKNFNEDKRALPINDENNNH